MIPIIMYLTSDNASVNDAMMQELKADLERVPGVTFDPVEQRGR